MFVDASVVVAILKQEEGWRTFAARLSEASKVYVSPLSIWESVLGLVKEAKIPFEDAEALVDGFVKEVNAQIIQISASIGREALTASRLYGRNRHPADLNFGDCFAYACAKAYRIPLLYKGDDFAQTDLA